MACPVPPPCWTTHQHLAHPYRRASRQLPRLSCHTRATKQRPALALYDPIAGGALALAADIFGTHSPPLSSAWRERVSVPLQ